MRQLRAAGVTGIIALLAAVFVTSASAAVFETTNEKGEQSYPSIVQAPLSEQEFSLGGFVAFTCSSSFEGSLAAKQRTIGTPSMCLPGAHLKSFNGGSCKYTLRLGKEVTASTFDGTLAIGGSACSGISLETSGPTCKYTLPPQSNLAKITFTDKAGSPSTVQVGVDVNSLTFQSETKSAECGGIGTVVGDWEGSWTLSAKNFLGEPLSLAVSGASAALARSGNTFVAETYPLTVAGAQSPTIELTGSEGMGGISCSTANLSGVLQGASSVIDLAPSLSGCTDSFGRSVEVKANGCQLGLNAAGSLGVSCAEGVSLNFLVKGSGGATVCTLSVPSQTGVGGVSYSSVGSGEDAGVAASLNVSSLTTVSSGGFAYCAALNGTHTDGALTGGITMLGGL